MSEASTIGEEDAMANIGEIQGRLLAFDASLSDVERLFTTVYQRPSSEVYAQLSTLEKAKFDLVGSFAMTSLFWMYLNVNGVNVKEHPIKQELDRIKTYMARAKEIQLAQERESSAPKLNKDASKRMVRNALWTAAQTSTPQTYKRQEDNNDDETLRLSKKKKL